LRRRAGGVQSSPITRKQLQVFGSWSSEPRHLKAALAFLEEHQQDFPFASMVSHRFPLEQADKALNTTARWESAKSVIVPCG
jgi:threonine dehydrogenase-like Zn-dependent dehydrogenase